MATAIPEITTATTIAFESYFGRITSMSLSGVTRPSIDITHFGSTTVREFMPGDLYDPGTLSVTAHFDATALPPIGTAAGALVITFPGTTGNIWTGTGFMTDMGFEGPLEDVMVVTATIKLDALIVVTATP